MRTTENIVLDLIQRKQEGSYWDFKKEWPAKNADLLHDIICMANSQENRDGYIIIGVDESAEYTIVDTSKNEHRKNTQKLVDFLKDKKFAGGIRPTVCIESLHIFGKIVDVIVVENSKHTPFYLEQKYEGIFAHHIYTRVQDTNTPKDKSADIDKIEYLWQKRFRLTETPLEQLAFYIKNKSDWIESPLDHLDLQYYKFSPEFTVKKTHDESTNGNEVYTLIQADTSPTWYNIVFKYHQTVIEYFQGVSLDGGRCFTTTPQIDGYDLGRRPGWDYAYKYFLKDSFEFAVHEFITDLTSGEAQWAYRKFSECILFFDNKNEKNRFNSYVLKNISSLKKLIKLCDNPYLPTLQNYNMDAFKTDYKVARALNQMLEAFRTEGS